MTDSEEREYPNSFKVAIIAFSFGITFSILSSLTGYDRINPPSGSTKNLQESISELSNDMPFILIVTVLTFILSLIFYKEFPIKKSSTLMCDRCNKKNTDPEKQSGERCDCWGAFHPINHYKWINE